MVRSRSGSFSRAIGSLAIVLAGVVLLLGQLPLSGAASGPAGRTPSSLASSHAAPPQQAAVDAAYGKLPLAFEVNAGQADASVRFLAHGAGYTLSLGDQAATLALRGTPADASATRPGADPAALLSRLSATGPRAQVGPASVQMTWIGGNVHPTISGEDPLPGTVNYFVGNDSSKWRTNIATYAKVRYADIYPGVDLIYYGTAGGALEYDLVVNPGADASRIQLAYAGSQGLSLDAQGNLQLRLANGQTITQPVPSVYQTVNGVRQAVSGGYTLSGNGHVGFALGMYDHALPLVIDPVIRYSTYLGGSAGDQGNAIAIDSLGAAYVTGGTFSTDFPTAGSPYHGSNAGGEDVFISKLNANGTALIYSTYLGGSSTGSSCLNSAGYDQGNAIALDASGDVYVAGNTASKDFPTTMGALQTSMLSGCFESFVTKLNASGSSLVYSTYLGGSLGASAYGLALDSSGEAFVTGSTISSDFPVKNAYQPSISGSYDAFVTKLNSTGTAEVYSTFLGGGGDDGGNGIALDGSGDAYVVGTTFSTNFPTTLGAFSRTCGCHSDAFVAKFSASGTTLTYSTFVGGSGNDFGNAIALDTSGNAYITGNASSTDFPTTPGAFQTTNLAAGFGNPTAYVTKLNTTGSALSYSTYLGGTGENLGNAITVDGAGYAYVAGDTYSSNFPVHHPVQATLTGNDDAFLVRMAPSGGSEVFGTYLGGTGNDRALGLALGPASTAYLTGTAGYTTVTSFPHPNALQPTFGGGLSDGFVAKINVLATPVQTVGAYDPASAVFFLRYANSGGNADNQFAFGPTGCTPIAGDWTGKGYDSIGIYCPNTATFYLRNANSSGNANIAFGFGPTGCQPLVGDWTGKNYDSVGVDCNGTFYLRNANAGGNADIVVHYGPSSGCSPVAGDWNGKGWDSIGIYCSGTFYLRNSNTAGNANIGVAFGPSSGCAADTGDWTGKGYDSIGVDCGGTYYLRNTNTPGGADLTFGFGAGSFKPMAGEWVPAPVS